MFLLLLLLHRLMLIISQENWPNCCLFSLITLVIYQCKSDTFPGKFAQKIPTKTCPPKIQWISCKISYFSVNLSLKILWNLTLFCNYLKPWLQYVTIHQNKGKTKFYHRWKRTTLYVIHFLPSVHYFPL